MESTSVKSGSFIRDRLEKVPAVVFTFYAIATAFSAYFCMYAFRKPFSASKYEGLKFFTTGINLKTAFIVSQVLGYTLSKYIGIKICSEVTRAKRMMMLIGMILFAELSLFLFAILPLNLKFVAIFLNGIPLGMVWGLVVWYLEGRKTSELLLAGLSCSFIVASGVVKDVGRWLMASHGVSQFWMPFLTGLIFLLPYIISVLLLNQLPDPTEQDEKERTHREPMDSKQRMAFIKRFFPALLMLFTAYFFLTAYRTFRDDYGIDIFSQLGYGKTPGIFSTSETWVAFGVLVPLAALFMIRNNRLGLIGTYCIMLIGSVLLFVGTLLKDSHAIDGLTWMILTGLGAYLTYVPYGSVLFDRIIADTKTIGTAVFAIYVADALGYTASIFVPLFKDLLHSKMSYLQFFRYFSYFMAILGFVMLLFSCIYILRSEKKSSL